MKIIIYITSHVISLPTWYTVVELFCFETQPIGPDCKIIVQFLIRTLDGLVNPDDGRKPVMCKWLFVWLILSIEKRSFDTRDCISWDANRIDRTDWLNGDPYELMSPSADGVKYSSAKDASLRIADVQRADNGTYECRAEVDSYGELLVRNVELNVQCEYEHRTVFNLFAYAWAALGLPGERSVDRRHIHAYFDVLDHLNYLLRYTNEKSHCDMVKRHIFNCKWVAYYWCWCTRQVCNVM